MKLYDWKFLSWLQRTMFFQNDFEKDCIEVGITGDISFVMSHSVAFKERNIVKMYENYEFDFLKIVSYYYKEYEDLTAG